MILAPKGRKWSFIYDCDGVIADTPQELAWKSACTDLGLINPSFDFTPFYQSSVAGVCREGGALTIIDKFEPHLGHMERKMLSEQIQAKKQENFLRLINSGQFKIFPDIKKIIERAAKEEIHQRVCSSSENSERIIVMSGLDGYFTKIVAGTKKYNAKNKTELYRIALQGLEEYNNFVWEDADKGVEAAREAGAIPLGIARPGLATPERLIEHGAYLAYDRQALDSMTWERLQKDLKKIICTRSHNYQTGRL